MAVDVQWNELELTLSGLNESVDQRVLPPGQLVMARNCDFSHKDGHVRKRPGTTIASDGPDTAIAHKLVVHPTANQVSAIDLQGTTSTPPKFYKYPDASSATVGELDPQIGGEVSEMLIRRYPVSHDLPQDIQADVAYVPTVNAHGFLVYGMINMQANELKVKIVQVRKNSTSAYEPEHTVYEAKINHAPDAGVAFQVRAAASLDDHVMITWQYESGVIAGIVVDCTAPGIPVLSGTTAVALVTNAVLNSYHDTCESTVTIGTPSTNPNWVLGYNNDPGAGISGVRIMRWHYAGGSLVNTWTSDVGAGSAVLVNKIAAISVLEKDNTTWINWWETGEVEGATYNADWFYACLTTSGGSSILAATVYMGAGDIGGNPGVNAGGWCSAIGLSNLGTEATMFNSQHTLLRAGTFANVPNGFADRPVMRWRKVNTAGGLSNVRQWFGVRILSKPWLLESLDNHAIWTSIDTLDNTVPFIGKSDGDVFPRYEHTAVLLRTNRSESLPAVMIGSMATRSVGNPTETALEGYFDQWERRWMEQGQSITRGAYRFDDSELERIGFRTTINVRYIPTERKSGPWDVVARDVQHDDYPEGFGRGVSVPFGGSVYITGGTLHQWDGNQIAEAGFVRSPNIQAELTATAGVWTDNKWGEGTIYFQATYEAVLSNGDRIISAPSAARAVTLDGTKDVAVPTKKVRLHIDALPATMRSAFSGSGETPQVIVVVYASAEPDDVVLHRWYEFSVPEWQIFDMQPGSGWIEVTFDESSIFDGSYSGTSPYKAGWYTAVDTHQSIYTDSGELDNDLIVGGCSAITVHRDRLWVAGGDDPEVLWYSKERVDGRPAEFNIAQQIRIPGVAVTALASVGDALFAFCENTIYAVLGEGPNATGDPSSGFFTVRPLTTTVGAACQSTVVVVPGAAIFRSSDGNVYAINSAGQVERAGSAVEDTYDRTPFASNVVQRHRQARILIGGATDDEKETRVLVLDWEKSIWSEWRYQFLDSEGMADQADLVDVKELGNRTFYLASNGKLYLEDSLESTWADNGNPYRMRLKTGWLSFGKMHGYKLLRHVSALMNHNPWSDLSTFPEAGTYGLRVTLGYNYAQTGFTDFYRWSSYEMANVLPQDSPGWVRFYCSKHKQPSMQMDILEEAPVQRIPGTIIAATYDTSTNDTLRILNLVKEDGSTVALTVITVTADATLVVATLVAEINAALTTAGLGQEMRAYVDSLGYVTLETVRGASFTVDSVANGSTLNTPLGYPVGGTDSSPAVAANLQSGFIIQSLGFEIGMLPGSRRLPAAQVR